MPMVYDLCVGNHPSEQCTISLDFYPPGFQTQAPPQQENESNLEELLARYIAQTETRMNSMEVSMRNLEKQVGKLAITINKHPQGTLPSDTKSNPMREGKEYCETITLQSGEELQGTVEIPTASAQTVMDEDIEADKKNNKNGEQVKKAEEDSVLSKQILIMPMCCFCNVF